MRLTLVRLCLPLAALLGFGGTARALTFNFTPALGMDPLAIAGFQAAGARWSALFTDNVTVNMNINFTTLGAGVLAQASSTQNTYTYTNVRNALITDSTSADDAIAVAHLPNAPAVNMMLNYTSNNPNGSGSATAYLDNDGDANNTTIRMTSANAKALGLLAGNAVASDASISFGNSFTWDFDPSNGITAGAFDFVGIAAHEIGHSLGFISGVDILDGNSPNNGNFFLDNQFTFVSTLDLYRRSALSLANGGNNTIDWTAGNAGAGPYFSIDGGTTNLANFSRGVTHGDGNQASHWRDNSGIGIMDPTAGAGELLTISARDVQGFDVIGWSLATGGVIPEPGTLALGLLGLGGLAVSKRVRRAVQ